ncbi:thiol-disulfide oxidoreductase DCC family protein [Shewanella electrodiphila]|uniref:Thiol-disulfide oxidoreductase DCC family protein n=1 Tax=Shewanella electrodiphila TaxID=934143 RepID=A0ABT0KIS6_9GAMM|nr:thiol-disulfide oxidoreductase DCC family protein [Shewanella electrodiphila]MCL1043735.1 thiol-disulfide oxidoreductase DCC family protein [Shewanella electrodiphila]
MKTQHIIIFDGVCNLCNGAVNFIIKRDHKDVFAFTPMQSETARALMTEYQLENIGFDSFILIKDGKYLLRSDAALEITKDLSGLWFLCRVFKVLPTGFQDYFYRVLAHNRYRIFGKKETCMLPTPELKSKFLK